MNTGGRGGYRFGGRIVRSLADDSLADVATLMWEARVGCVLVVEGDDKLVGIITEGDFLRVAHHFLRQAGAGSES